MQRITIIGTSCSGKTTLANRLSQKLNIPHLELDQLHWRENWTINPNFMTEVESATSQPEWVIDGNYTKVRQLIWNNADTLIWLNYSFPLVFFRALKRSYRRVTTKKKLFGGNVETWQITLFSSDSILWWVIKTYRRRKREYSIIMQSEDYPHINKIELKSPKELERFLSNL